jgi:hypothetical protein
VSQLTLRGDWVEIDMGMTNFDHAIEPGFEDALRRGGVWGRHAAWNFNGRVWFEDGEFHEQVWVYGAPRAILSASTLEDLMCKVNDEYGSD